MFIEDLQSRLKALGTTKIQITKVVEHPTVVGTHFGVVEATPTVKLSVSGVKAEAYAEFMQAATDFALNLKTPNTDLIQKYKHLPSFPRIVSAAMKLADGFIIPSARHFDITVHNTCRRLGLTAADTSDAEQGFIDNFGNFYTREEAHAVAFANNQIIRRVGGDARKLYSENLY